MGGYDAPEVDEAKGIIADTINKFGNLLISLICRLVPLAKDVIVCPDSTDATGIAPDAEAARYVRNAAAASGSGVAPTNVTGGST